MKVFCVVALLALLGLASAQIWTPVCISLHCAGQWSKCLADKQCRDAIGCVRHILTTFSIQHHSMHSMAFKFNAFNAVFKFIILLPFGTDSQNAKCVLDKVEANKCNLLCELNHGYNNSICMW